MTTQEKEMTTQEKVDALVERLDYAAYEIGLHSETYEVLSRHEDDLSTDAKNAFSRRLCCLSKEVLAVSLELEGLDIEPTEKMGKQRRNS